MLRLRYHPAARAELRAAITEAEDERKGRGFALESAIERVELRLSQLPHSAPRWPADLPLEIRKAKVQRFPFLVVYTIQSDELIVVAIAHTRREPGYWLERV